MHMIKDWLNSIWGFFERLRSKKQRAYMRAALNATPFEFADIEYVMYKYMIAQLEYLKKCTIVDTTKDVRELEWAIKLMEIVLDINDGCHIEYGHPGMDLLESLNDPDTRIVMDVYVNTRNATRFIERNLIDMYIKLPYELRRIKARHILYELIKNRGYWGD